MAEGTTQTGVVLRAMAFANKEVDDALGLQVLSVRVTRDGLRALESAADKGACRPLMAFIRQSLEAQTGILLGLSSDLQMPAGATEDGLDWPVLEQP